MSGGAACEGLLASRSRLLLSTRVLGHMSLTLHAWHETRNTRWLVAGGIAMAGDVAWWTVLRRTAKPLFGYRTIFDCADAAMWAMAAGDNPALRRAVALVAAMAPGIEAGFRTAAGRDAVPVPAGSRPFPPPGRNVTKWIAPLARTLVPPALPLVAASSVKRLRGRPVDLGHLSWSAVCGGAGVALARIRDRNQRLARAEWARRVQPHLSAEYSAARIMAATRPSPGHDFKKTLAVLGDWGSEAAWQAALEQMGRPAVLLGASHNGSTFYDAARLLGAWPEPQESWCVWLSSRQLADLTALVGDVRRWRTVKEATNPTCF